MLSTNDFCQKFATYRRNSFKIVFSCPAYFTINKNPSLCGVAITLIKKLSCLKSASVFKLEMFLFYQDCGTLRLLWLR